MFGFGKGRFPEANCRHQLAICTGPDASWLNRSQVGAGISQMRASRSRMGAKILGGARWFSSASAGAG
jgi:hypothetical protein